MATPKPFRHAGFLERLEQLDVSAASPALPPEVARMLSVADGSGSPAASLIALLKAHRAVLQSAANTASVADGLRRYQKFSKPGAPSPHIVQLRQQQAAARQASNQARQSLMQAAAAFVREAGITVPPRQALDAFITGWINAHIPTDEAAAD